MWHALIALALLTTSDTSAEVTVTQLDGSTTTGTLESWDHGSCVFSTPTGREEIPESQLLSIQWSPDPRSRGAVQPTLDLVDGTVLPIVDYRTSNGAAQLILHNASPRNERAITVPLDRVRAAWLLPMDDNLAEQWKEVRELHLPSDVLVVVKQDGNSLDYLEGVVGEITDAEVEFTLDGRTVRVQRSKVAGVVYFRGERTAESSPSCVLLGANGLRAAATQVRLADDRVSLVTAGKIKLTWPVADLHTADFSAGKVASLSDLEPVSERWTPWVGLPPDTTLAAEFGRPRRDESSYGGPLAVRTSDDTSAPAAELQTFSKGLALRSRTELVYRLPRGYSRFLTVAGMEPATSRSGDVRLVIEGDGRELWNSRVTGNQAPLAVDLEIAGVKRLTILVDYGDNLDTGDWLNLCNARIVK